MSTEPDREITQRDAKMHPQQAVLWSPTRSIPEPSTVRFGTGLPCHACDEPINPHEPGLEYEVVPGKGPRLRVHCLCVAIWGTAEEMSWHVGQLPNHEVRIRT